MTTNQAALDIFVNALRVNIDDIIQKDIDDNYVSFRASKSYWISEGWIDERWRDHGLPQIAVFQIASRDAASGKKTKSERYTEDNFQVDIFASGRNQKQDLTNQIRKSLFNYDNRMSMLRSGIKLDKIISQYDTIEDEILPQQVYRKQMSFKVYYHTSGA